MRHRHVTRATDRIIEDDVNDQTSDFKCLNQGLFILDKKKQIIFKSAVVMKDIMIRRF